MRPEKGISIYMGQRPMCKCIRKQKRGQKQHNKKNRIKLELIIFCKLLVFISPAIAWQKYGSKHAKLKCLKYRK